jgi:hypothetical protein
MRSFESPLSEFFGLETMMQLSAPLEAASAAFYDAWIKTLMQAIWPRRNWLLSIWDYLTVPARGANLKSSLVFILVTAKTDKDKW